MVAKKTTDAKRTTETAGAAAFQPQQVVSIPALRIGRVRVTVVGESPLITHKWAEKAKKSMRDKQQQVAKAGREKRNPEQECKEATYFLPKPTRGCTCGIPAIAFKLATVRAAKSVDMPMTDARSAFHVRGELIPIEGTPEMREDMVRVGNGAADLRYRPMFWPWSAVLEIDFNEALLSADQTVNLLNIAGFGTGVGEWRPEKDGEFGRFRVASGAQPAHGEEEEA